MHPDKPTPRPTDAELAILNVLWERGPSSVRDVQWRDFFYGAPQSRHLRATPD